MTLSGPQRRYLIDRPLARLATVDADGAPRINPLGALCDGASGDIVVGGAAMGSTRQFAIVAANPHGALVVDDSVSRHPWTVRGLEIRGRTVAVDDVDPPIAFMSR